MRKLLSLIRVGLKANFGLSILRQRLFREKKDIWLIPVTILGLAGLLPLGFLYIEGIKQAYQLLAPAGQQNVIVLFAILTGQLFVMIFGLYYVVAALYFSKDIEILIPLPLEPFEVMLSKFVVILVNEYLTLFPVVAPVLICFGILSGGGPGYWTQAVTAYLLIPVIPLSVISFLVVGMMRLINFSRKKDFLVIVGTLLLIVAVVAFQLVIGRATESSSDLDKTIRALSSPDGFLNRIGAVFPPSIWAAKAVTGGFSGNGLLNLAFLAGTSALFFAATVIVSEKLFYRGLIGISEVGSSPRALPGSKVSGLAGSGGPLRAILVRELRIMNRTPIFALNGIGSVFLIPLLLLVMTRAGGRGVDDSMLKILHSANPCWVIIGAACFLTICACLNGTSSSTFSREGFQFWISKVIPVSPRTQVLAKLLHSYSVALLGVAMASVVLALGFHPTAGDMAIAILLAIPASFVLTLAGMAVDLARPLLDWTNPQKAIKQNLNVMLALFLEIGILAALGFLSRALAGIGLGTFWILAVLFLLLSLLSAGLFVWLIQFAARRYEEIEV